MRSKKILLPLIGGLILGGVLLSQTLMSEEKLTPFEIKISGGGIYGGINPTTESWIQLKNKRVTSFHASLYGGEEKKEGELPAQDSRRLAKLLLKTNFFELPSILECKDCDGSYPPKVPLEVNVKLGNKEKKVTFKRDPEESLLKVIQEIKVSLSDTLKGKKK